MSVNYCARKLKCHYGHIDDIDVSLILLMEMNCQ